MDILQKLKDDCGDDPEDYLRDLAGTIRHKAKHGEPVELREAEAEVLDAIADLLQRARDRLRANCERPAAACAILVFGWDHIGNDVIQCPGCLRKAQVVRPLT